MTKIRLLTIFCYIFATFFIANSANAANIAILDLENVIKNSDVMRDVQQKLELKQAEFQKEINKKQKPLEAEEKKLLSRQKTLSKTAFETEKKKFSNKILKLQNDVESKQSLLKKDSIRAISKINDKIKEIIEELKTEKNIDVIIPSSAAIFYKDELDISGEVLKRLNKKISKLKI